MASQPSNPALQEGDTYFDVDGTPVVLVRIVGNICCWLVAGQEWNERQYTLEDQFIVRFRRAIENA